MKLDKETLQIGCSCVLAGLLLAELTCRRASLLYFAVLVGGAVVLTSVVAMVVRKWFANIEKAKQALYAEDAAYAALPLGEAKLKVERLLRNSDRFHIGQPGRDLSGLKIVGVLTKGFFDKVPSLVDTKGELTLELRADAQQELKAIGDVLIIGQNGAHTLIVLKPSSDEVIEVFEPNTSAQEFYSYPSLYHFLARYGDSHGELSRLRTG